MISHQSRFLTLVLFILVACESNRVSEDLGPQVTSEEIIRAQRKSLSGLDPYDIRQNQRVHRIETQEVISTQGSMKNLSREWVTTVVELNNTDDYRELVIIEEVFDREWDKDFIYKFKDVFYLPQLSSQQLLSQQKQSDFTLNQLVERLKTLSDSEGLEVTGMAFHNLQVREVSLSPPQLVKSSPNCKGLTECQLRADMITYDIVFQLSDESIQKHTVEWYISAQVPFFAGIMKQCATSLVPIDNARVLVKQCDEVVDFDF
jgi:hypothetical protein